MATQPMLEAPHPADARITGGFWAGWQQVNRAVTIPYVLDKCDETNRTRSLRLEWTPGADWEPHQFYDSDLAKAIEAAAYALASEPDAELEARLDGYIRLFAAAQRPDGYLNSYYTQKGLDQRWTNLRDMHELYCAGHLFEAAVAHYRSTGARSLLDIATRYADHIDATFGPSGLRGYPGHEEIELALVKLAEATGEQRYFDLARYFVNERGREPHYFRTEAEKRGEVLDRRRYDANDYPQAYAYYQAHVPVREQTDAEGHSVRACYLYAGMVDVATRTGDQQLMDACRRLFDSIAVKRMYISGGIGSHSHGERFTFDHDLPNESAYAETCAAIALVFFASRMANATLDGRYADVMERALYNGAIGGLSLSGDRFFYANPLSFHADGARLPHVRSDAERQPWYGCACCPPNIARLLASLGSYIYGVGTGASGDPVAAVHLYAESSLQFQAGGTGVTLRQQTDYPWTGDVALTVDAARPVAFTLALRIPGWADGWSTAWATLEGDQRGPRVENGYAFFDRTWEPGECLHLRLPMAVRRTHADPAVRQDGWKVALERGPLLYCVEGVDNGPQLANLALPAGAPLRTEHRDDLLGGCTVIAGEAVRRATPPAGSSGTAAALYATMTDRQPVPFTAVPFALRNNRGACEMRVWLAEL